MEPKLKGLLDGRKVGDVSTSLHSQPLFPAGLKYLKPLLNFKFKNFVKPFNVDGRTQKFVVCCNIMQCFVLYRMLYVCVFACSGGIGYMETFIRSIQTTSRVPLMEMRIDCLWSLDTDISRGFGSPTVGSTLSQSQQNTRQNAGKLIGRNPLYSCHHYLIPEMLIS